ncbi:MAG: hypothetical protein II916_00115 [Oscillospiraceae bacterium]|nr:hypothetical protein [Oscillospiraceae bacterium]
MAKPNKKRIAVAAVILLAIAAGGGSLAAYSRHREQLPVTPDDSIVTLDGDWGMATEPESTEPTTEFVAPNYPAVPLNVSPVVPAEAELRIEAENAEYTGQLGVEDMRTGYSGEGYLAGFSKHEGDSVEATFEVPSPQHYNVTISVCADSPVTNSLMLNGEKLGDFTIDESEFFTRVTFSGVYIPEGTATLSIEEVDGYFALDYFEIENCSEMYDIPYTAEHPLSDPKASDGAKALMQFLSEQYGKKVISGQYAAGDADTELELIYRLTGKYPAIRFGDVESITDNSTADSGDVIAACERWAESGGIVGLMWHWDAPTGVSTVYAKDADFSLIDALPPYEVINEIVEEDTTETDTTEPETEEDEDVHRSPYLPEPTEAETEPPEYVERFSFSMDVALMDDQEIEQNVQSGKLSEDCAAILHDIDSVAKAMKPLADKDIPVLWRPLHEAGGDWFWWGADGAEAYRWLWDVMYRRMTEYHGLHNLIWIWNGQSAEYLVEQYDIASLDIYMAPDKEFGSRYEQFVSLERMTGGEKILALSEASTIPDLNLMYRDNTIWSFFGLWYGDYLIDANGKYNEKYTPANQMIAAYNSQAVITRDRVHLGDRTESTPERSSEQPEETESTSEQP